MAALAAERYLSEKGLLKEMPPLAAAAAGPVTAEASRPVAVIQAKPSAPTQPTFASE